MLKITVPATTANLCVGFDCIGMALSIYNEYGFELSVHDDVSSFEERYQTNNLVLESYKHYFNKYNLEYKPVKITLIKQDIPTSRGLGSSAACIVAGVYAASILSDSYSSFEMILNACVDIEGHPDNVLPALEGGMVASFKGKEEYQWIKYSPSYKLSYHLLIPDFELSTNEARRVLPDSYSKQDVVHNLGRMACLPKIIEGGYFNMLRDLFDDKIHEPYRFGLIPNASKIKESFNTNYAALCISGAGPTLLVIGQEGLMLNDDICGFKTRCVLPDMQGVKIENV